MSPPPTLGASNLRSMVVKAATLEIDNPNDSASPSSSTSSSLDLAGIAWMEHINLVVGDLDLAAAFYIDFLGFTRDPSTASFHINLGQQQLHLAAPKTKDKNKDNESSSSPAPHVIAGSVGLTLPNLQTVIDRIPQAQETLAGTKFQIVESSSPSPSTAITNDGCMTVICPWGNRFHLYDMTHDAKYASSPLSSDSQPTNVSPLEPNPRKMDRCHDWGGNYGSHAMAIRQQPGIRYVEFTCRTGTSAAIAQFYRQILQCQGLELTMNVEEQEHIAAKTVDGFVLSVGPGVHLLFVEHGGADDDAENDNDNDKSSYDAWMQAMQGIHLCIYVLDFGGLYQRLDAENLIWSNPRFQHLDACDTWDQARRCRTLRFRHILHVDTKQPIFELEHETRPLRHGQYMKMLHYERK